MNAKYIIFFVLGLFTFVAADFDVEHDEDKRHDALMECVRIMEENWNLPPVDSSIIFPTASVCEGCHGYDSTGTWLVDFFGNDVNMHDDWNPSMMANSAKDPFWRAKVSHEVLVNPAHADDIETVCTSCHAPMGHYTAILRGHEHYTMSDLLVDTIGLDGVSCSSCHKISAEALGDLNSGDIRFDTTRVIFGPYAGPFDEPMTEFVGFEPLYAPHINEAGLCASCHSLVVESLDLNGEPTGSFFVEQATYHEWLNSDYVEEEETTCQGCHMPRLEEEVVIAKDYPNLEGRFPYGLHDLVGANTAMLQLMKDNKSALGINATDAAYDETIQKTMTMLKAKSVDVSLSKDTITNDTAKFEVQIRNKAGHKFPSGYPSRRAFVQFIAITAEGDTLFKSGTLTSNYEVVGHDAHYEPHYEVITQEDQVQIYEQVNGNIISEFSTVLEQAYLSLKDNRLPPLGFRTDHEVYDTTLIVGNALSDTDFNKNELGEEGSGTDVIRYHIPTNGYVGEIMVSAKVFYQSLPPKWMAPMFEFDSPEINSFKNMWNEADQSPVEVGEDTLQNVVLDFNSNIQFIPNDIVNIYPNPNSSSRFELDIPSDLQINKIVVYNELGQLVELIENTGRFIEIEGKGTYFVEIQTSEGVLVKKVLRL